MNVLVALQQTNRHIATGCTVAVLLMLGSGAARATADGFQLFADHNGYVPATFTHAVGPDHIVAATYQMVRYFAKDGTLELELPFSDFFPGSGGLYEPKAIFDPYDRRFMLAGGDYMGYLGFAVSDDADPHGAWITQYFNVEDLVNRPTLARRPTTRSSASTAKRSI